MNTRRMTPPLVMKLGILILVVGCTLDLIYHSAPSAWLPTLEIYLGRGAFLAHLVTGAGAVGSTLGLFVRPKRAPQSTTAQT